MSQSSLVAIFAIAFIIFFHETGHWLVARMLGMSTPVFSVGFGGRKLSVTLGKFWQTEFRLGFIPLGGYVVLPEMQEGESRKAVVEEFGLDEEELSILPTWKKVLVAFAGPFANLLLAYLLYAGLLCLHRGLSPADALTASFDTTLRATASVLTGLAMILHLIPLDPTLPEGATDLHSVVGIFQVLETAAGTSLVYFGQVIAYLSLNLAVLNLVPLPMLDGGQIVILLFEKLRGRAISDSTRYSLTVMTLLFIAGLTFIGLFNDFARPIVTR